MCFIRLRMFSFKNFILLFYILWLEDILMFEILYNFFFSLKCIDTKLYTLIKVHSFKYYRLLVINYYH